MILFTSREGPWVDDPMRGVPELEGICTVMPTRAVVKREIQRIDIGAHCDAACLPALGELLLRNASDAVSVDRSAHHQEAVTP